MHTKTEAVAIVRAKLGDEDLTNPVWKTVDLETIYDQFIVELNRRNPYLEGIPITPGDKWNNVVINYMLSNAFAMHSEDELNRKRWEDYLALYEHEMGSLSLIK